MLASISVAAAAVIIVVVLIIVVLSVKEWFGISAKAAGMLLLRCGVLFLYSSFFLSLLITLAKFTSALGAEKGNGVAHHCPASWALLLATLLRLAMLKLPATAWAELFTPITRSSAVATDRDAKELNLPKRVFLWQ